MGSEGGVRVRCTAWDERETAHTAQCSTVNWSTALVEELLETETNVITDRSIAVLKELDIPGAALDPVLMSDVRHNKDIRSFLGSGRLRPSNCDIIMEAKRIIKREEKAKKMLNTQNKIVDDEVDRFQNHIKNLRKMNQRLERIAFPVVKKRHSKINSGHYLSSYYLSKGDSLNSVVDNHSSSIVEDKSKKKTPIRSINIVRKTDEGGDTECSRRKPGLLISGNKMDEHEILQHKPMSLQNSSVCQNTVFERIHQKYIESERNRVLKDGTSLIRHPSPINDFRQPVQPQQASINSCNISSFSKDDREFYQGEWVPADSCPNQLPSKVIQKSDVVINEWESSSKPSKDRDALKRKHEMKRATSPSKTLPPAIISKKSDHNKLDSLSKMYAKWMTKVCVAPNTKFEDFGSFKNKLEKGAGSISTRHLNNSSLSREDKIMQVLEALQRQKESKPAGVKDTNNSGSSRFSKSVNDIREEKLDQDNPRFRRAISGSYEHRLKAHKELISHQKTKLEEQKKEIEELKLSQLQMESEKSQILTQKALNEVLETCSENVKAQAKSLKSCMSLADLSPGNDFVLRMEQRALEQKQKKLVAQERRKQLEEERKRKAKEFQEKERLEEEELMRKKHEVAQETRRKEREMREEARKEREKIIALERKADLFCQRRRLKSGLCGFKTLLLLRNSQEEIAVEFHDKYVMRNAFNTWKREVESIQKAKLECAEKFHSANMLYRCFNSIKSEVQERERWMQVAMDVHDFHLQERYFRVWLKFTEEQQEIEAEKMARAELHLSKVLLWKYLLKWQKYPKVAQLEREKERRKMVWRNKVQQLLPDFRPVFSSD